MFAVLRAIARYMMTGLTIMGQAYAPTLPVPSEVEPSYPTSPTTEPSLALTSPTTEPSLEEELFRPRATVR